MFEFGSCFFYGKDFEMKFVVEVINFLLIFFLLFKDFDIFFGMIYMELVFGLLNFFFCRIDGFLLENILIF